MKNTFNVILKFFSKKTFILMSKEFWKKIHFFFTNISFDIYFILLIFLLFFQIILSMKNSNFIFKIPTFLLVLFFIMQFSQKSSLNPETFELFGVTFNFKNVRFFCIFFGLFGLASEIPSKSLCMRSERDFRGISNLPEGNSPLLILPDQVIFDEGLDVLKKTTISELEIVGERSLSLALLPLKVYNHGHLKKLQELVAAKSVGPQLQIYVANQNLKADLLEIGYRTDVIQELVVENSGTILKRGVSSSLIAFGAIGNANMVCYNGTIGTSIIPMHVPNQVRFAVASVAGINGSAFSAMEIIAEQGPARALLNKSKRELALKLKKEQETLTWNEEYYFILSERKVKSTSLLDKLIIDSKIDVILKNLDT